MTEVNVAELRGVLEVPPVEYTVFPLGSNVPYIHKEQSTTVIVNRSTLTALLDAYEREQGLREFARELWEYVKAHWDGTRQYADLLEEARALGIVEAPSDA